MSPWHASESWNERYKGKERLRLYEVAKVEISSASVNRSWEVPLFDIMDVYGGGSSAENAGINEQIVQALSGVGSCNVVRLS